MQNTIGRLGQSARETPVSNAPSHEEGLGTSSTKKFFPPLEVWPADVMLMILPQAMERNSAFAVASRRARGLSLENAINVVGDAIHSGGRANNGAAREAHLFIRKIILSGSSAVAAGAESAHEGSDATSLGAAVGLLARSARQVLNGDAVAPDAPQDDPEAHWRTVVAADRAIKTFLSYVYIEAGEFTMGASEAEPGRLNDEVRHRVRLTRPFMLKATAVTQGEWFELMGNNPSQFQKDGPNGERAAKRPVERVNWYDTLAYCNALSRREGYGPCYDLDACSGTPGVNFSGPIDIPFDEHADGFRLPSEAQWEYAARAGTQTATYTTPGQSLDDIAWTNGEHDSLCRTYPVELKLPNAWGLDGMIGNTSEWTGDKYGPLAPTHDSPTVDPCGPDTGFGRVVRGDTWHDEEYGSRVAPRYTFLSVIRHMYLSFRPVKSLFT